MKDEKKFTKPEVEVIEFNNEDVIVTSLIGGATDEGIPSMDD